MQTCVDPYPPTLMRLLGAGGDHASEQAWSDFVQTYSQLLLQVVRPLGTEYDGTMDRYAYVLEQLHQHGYSRLRSYVPRPGVDFSIWLRVVARRLCIDYYRSRYGRARPSATAAESPAGRRHARLAPGAKRIVRRRLADFAFLTDALDAIGVMGRSDSAGETPDTEFAAAERSRTVTAIISRLEARDQLLLRLRFEDELSAQQIANILAFPTQFHVYRRLRGVLTRLETELRALGVHDASH
jgi:RNA polymerase sigma factor (sigma-70 family)